MCHALNGQNGGAIHTICFKVGSDMAVALSKRDLFGNVRRVWACDTCATSIEAKDVKTVIIPFRGRFLRIVRC